MKGATNAVSEGDLLWAPSAERAQRTNLTHYMRWLAARGRRFGSYGNLWQWSIDDQEGFWGSLWEYFDVRASRPYERVLKSRSMPGARSINARTAVPLSTASAGRSSRALRDSWTASPRRAPASARRSVSQTRIDAISSTATGSTSSSGISLVWL